MIWYRLFSIHICWANNMYTVVALSFIDNICTAFYCGLVEMRSISRLVNKMLWCFPIVSWYALYFKFHLLIIWFCVADKSKSPHGYWDRDSVIYDLSPSIQAREWDVKKTIYITKWTPIQRFSPWDFCRWYLQWNLYQDLAQH